MSCINFAADNFETKLKDAVINGVMRTVQSVFDLAPQTFNLILVRNHLALALNETSKYKTGCECILDAICYMTTNWPSFSKF